jgi:quinol monooxygenase YgiN
MKPMALSIVGAMALGACAVAAQDTTSHSVQFVTVQPDVNVEVVEGGVEAFESATLENARASLREPGIARFDVIQAQDDPRRFVLIEVYRDADAPGAHKETPHYLKWRDAVAPLMARPRTSQKYLSLSPPEAGWETPGAR